MITFNGTLREIFLSPGTVELNVPDLYSRWKDWVQEGDNSKWPIAFTSVGGDVVDQTAGTYIPAYIYLQNNWHVHPQMANHTLNVTGGILLRQGGGDPFEDIPGYTIRINYSQPVQAVTVATGGGGGIVPADVWQGHDIEGGLTAEQFMRLILSAVSGKLGVDLNTGIVTTRDIADTKDRLTIETDADGRRLDVTRDVS